MTVVFGFDALVKKIRFFLSLYFNVKLYILIKGPLALTIWTKDFIYEKNFFSDKEIIQISVSCHSEIFLECIKVKNVDGIQFLALYMY